MVGGGVRDLLLGRAPHELDLVVEGDALAVARRAAARLGGAVVIHQRFGTATVQASGVAFDLAGARAETYPRPGALPEVRLGAPLREDLARRDFTVNAIALRLADGELTEWPGALDDLAAGRLRVLHDGSFHDDATRLLRLARYAGRLGFAVEEHTGALAREAVAAGAPRDRHRRAARRGAPPARPGAAARGARGAGRDRPRRRAARPVVRRPPGAGRGGGRRLPAGGPPRPRRAGRRRAAARSASRSPRGSAPSRSRRPRRPWSWRRRRSPSGSGRRWTRPRRCRASTRCCGGSRWRRRPWRRRWAWGRRAPSAAWLAEGRHRRLAISGHDLVAAGLQGPAVGEGLAAARAALLDGRADTAGGAARGGARRGSRLAASLGRAAARSPPPPPAARADA